VKDANDEHPEKQELKMDIINVGIVMDVQDEHLKKQEFSMEAIDLKWRKKTMVNIKKNDNFQ
jgi:hypothetical protein